MKNLFTLDQVKEILASEELIQAIVEEDGILASEFFDAWQGEKREIKGMEYISTKESDAVVSFLTNGSCNFFSLAMRSFDRGEACFTEDGEFWAPTV